MKYRNYFTRILRKYFLGKKIKIGYVIPGTGIYGGISVVCEHVNGLLFRGYDVTMISEDNQSSISWFPDQKVEVVPLNIINKKFDALVATGWSTAYIVNQMTAPRKYYFVQSDETRFFKVGDDDVHKALNTYAMDFEFITMARWLQKWLKDRFGKDAIYIPNGINHKIFYQTYPVAKKGNKVRVLLEGSINNPLKGMEDAFRAVEGVDCEVWCVSTWGKPKPEWKCDRFFERVDLAQMKNIYSSCDILLKMSHVESFSMPPLEMMSCGGTVVIAKVTGIDEYIVHEYNALVVEQGDVQAAHHALKQLVDDKNLRLKLAANGKITAKKWRWEPSIDMLEELFEKYV